MLFIIVWNIAGLFIISKNIINSSKSSLLLITRLDVDIVEALVYI